jgi:CDP-diacylglycerol--glycerol-3-phosphate 3-phosphatidyltransferase
MAELTRRTLGQYFTEPVVRLLARTGVAPNTVSWVGFALTLVTAALAGMGYLPAAGLAMLVAGYCDILDGALARRTNRVTAFGGILDSTLDRLSESAVLLGVVIFYLFFTTELRQTGIVLAVLALIGSLLVSYIRARAEAQDLECKVGLFTRPERVVVLTLSFLFMALSHYALPVALGIVVILSFITVGQRVNCVWKQTKHN